MFVKPLAANLPGIQFKRPITVSVKKNLSIKEHLLTSATDMVECLRMDPSKVILLKFYLGNTEDSLMLNQSNKFREFLGGNGNLFPLIDALDGCHNESVNMKDI